MNEFLGSVAIATFCGWSFKFSGELRCKSPDDNDWRSIKELPNYFEDLNAMHKAEKFLTRGQKEIYCQELAGLFAHGAGSEWYDGYKDAVCAAALLRAETFIKVVYESESIT